MDGVPPTSYDINTTRKPHLRRQVFQVASKVAIRKEILKTLKILKCFRIRIS